MEFFKFHSVASRNIFQDLVVGFNRPTSLKNEQVDAETARMWLKQDWEKAKKRVAKYRLDNHEPSVYLSFIAGIRRFSAFTEIFESISKGSFVHACVAMGNHRMLKDHPALVTALSDSILKGESHSEYRKRLGDEIAQLVRGGAE